MLCKRGADGRPNFEPEPVRLSAIEAVRRYTAGLFFPLPGFLALLYGLHTI
jgi:hypothetical protein